MTVVSAVTTSSTNITGFLISVRGLSLAKAAPIAGTTIFQSNSAETGLGLRTAEVSICRSGSIRREQRARRHGEMLGDRTKRERREERQPADDHDHADDQADEEAAGRRERAGRWWDRLLFGERAGDRNGRDDHPEAADQHRDGAGDVI